MTEETWAAHGGIPACDSCHSKKVKCDRKDPCSTCIRSEVECLRNRRKCVARPRLRTEERIQNLVKKLSSLEEAVGFKSSQTIQPADDRTSPNASVPEILPIDARPSAQSLKRKRVGNILNTQGTLSPPESVASQQQNNEYRNFIQKELSLNDTLATHQRSVLETAIEFVDHLSQGPTSTGEVSWWSEKVPTDFAPGELIQIIVSNQRKETDSAWIRLHRLDHIPPKALETIVVKLLDGSDDERILNMCKVIAHFKAALDLYSSQLEAPKSPAIREHIKQMQLHHLGAALTALDHVSFMNPPSLLLLQTLLTGALLMHVVGNTQCCWSLTAHASRTLVALGYHNISDTVRKCDEDEMIHAAVAWCYHFDRLTSLLLLRPMSLPPLKVPVSSLIPHDPTNPMSIFATGMLAMVPVHEKILELSLETSSAKTVHSRPSINDEVTQLQNKLSEIHTVMEKSRPLLEGDANQDLVLHWLSLEFKYFSTLTAVHRLSPTAASNPLERERCLQCARTALGYVKQIKCLAEQQGHFPEGYSPYLSMTILSYPLCPFFVIFCNVVGTSNLIDFRLLQDVVDSLSSPIVEDKYAGRLHRLCSTLLALCKPLVQTSAPELQILVPGPTEEPVHTNAVTQSVDTEKDSGSATGIIQPTNEVELSSWDNEMMWQLFHCQPSLDWFDSDILDPTTWNLA